MGVFAKLEMITITVGNPNDHTTFQEYKLLHQHGSRRWALSDGSKLHRVLRFFNNYSPRGRFCIPELSLPIEFPSATKYLCILIETWIG